MEFVVYEVSTIYLVLWDSYQIREHTEQTIVFSL